MPPRLPDHQCSRVSQWNLKIGFYPSFDRCHKGNRLYRAGLRARSNSDILIARPPVALITILIPVFTRPSFNDDCGSDRCTTARIEDLVPFSDIERQKETRANKTWHLRSKNALKNIRMIKYLFKDTVSYMHSLRYERDAAARASLLTVPFNK